MKYDIDFRNDGIYKDKDILGGLRSTGTYIGASRIKDFPKCATFLKVNRVLNKNMDRHENII